MEIAWVYCTKEREERGNHGYENKQVKVGGCTATCFPHHPAVRAEFARKQEI